MGMAMSGHGGPGRIPSAAVLGVPLEPFAFGFTAPIPHLRSDLMIISLRPLLFFSTPILNRSQQNYNAHNDGTHPHTIIRHTTHSLQLINIRY
jgi:hypothetical protein